MQCDLRSVITFATMGLC